MNYKINKNVPERCLLAFFSLKPLKVRDVSGGGL